MSQYSLGAKTIETLPSGDGQWRVRRYIWPASILDAHPGGDPAFDTEALAVAAVERSSGRTLRPIEMYGSAR